MAFIRNSGMIVMSRGDDFVAPLFINIGTDTAPVRVNFNKFNDLDVLFLIVTKDSSPKELFRKKFTYKDANEYGDIVIHLTSDDTRKLLAGNYNYTVTGTMFDETTNEDYVYTIVPETSIMIM